jgi:hypothetical protein
VLIRYYVVQGSACLSPISKVMVAAVNFFLGIETKMHEDDEEEKVFVVQYHRSVSGSSGCGSSTSSSSVGISSGSSSGSSRSVRNCSDVGVMVVAVVVVEVLSSEFVMQMHVC